MENQDGWFLSKLDVESKSAIDRLCKAGCDRKLLSSHLAALTYIFETIVLPAIDPVTGNRVRPRDLQIGPSDSWNRLLDRMSLEGLETIKRQAEKLMKDVERLWSLPLVAELRNESRFAPHGLLGSPIPVVQTVFNDLLILPDLAREYGPGTHRAYTRILTDIYRYIKLKTGRWHDVEMVPILCKITPNSPTVDYLKKWRADHHLTRKGR